MQYRTAPKLRIATKPSSCLDQTVADLKEDTPQKNSMPQTHLTASQFCLSTLPSENIKSASKFHIHHQRGASIESTNLSEPTSEGHTKLSILPQKSNLIKVSSSKTQFDFTTMWSR
jgi:hypothetical protein